MRKRHWYGKLCGINKEVYFDERRLNLMPTIRRQNKGDLGVGVQVFDLN